MREISTEDLKSGEHIIIDGVEYVAKDGTPCDGCDLFDRGYCHLVPCTVGITLKRVEKQDGLPDSKPGPLMSLYEYPALRDHFAMAALKCFDTDVFADPYDYLAEKAYKVANAMMEARKK